MTLFTAFGLTGLSGFGGVLPFAYRMLVERRRWLTPGEFAPLLALAQVLPGANVCNLAIMVGWRFAGLAGAVAAYSGIIVMPMVLVIAIGLTYAAVASQPAVRHALAGMSAVAAGLVLATAVKMARGYVKGVLETAAAAPAAAAASAAASASASASARQGVQDGRDGSDDRSTPRALAGRPWAILALAAIVAVLAFAGVAVMRWPLIAVVAGLLPIAAAANWLVAGGRR